MTPHPVDSDGNYILEQPTLPSAVREALTRWETAIVERTRAKDNGFAAQWQVANAQAIDALVQVESAISDEIERAREVEAMKAVIDALKTL